MSHPSSTAGRADPYWYEWFVGLREVVELLNPQSNVTSVAFQLQGEKGWDDVVVTLRENKRRCYQVKHTRAGDSLTFSDLVSPNDKGKSLLGSLFKSWRKGGLNDGATTCVLFTNREAGQRWSKTQDGVRWPPLLKFWAWLQKKLSTAESLSDVSPLSNYQEAWDRWKSVLTPGTDEERLAFLQALEIRDKQNDLEGLEKDVRQRLARAFGVTAEMSASLFDALIRALKKWTTGHPGVSVEDLCSELTLPPVEKELAPAPPPPTPFFPSRIPIADNLDDLLKSENTPPVIFLTAEPGSGKTSVISRLTNKRSQDPLTGVVGARFFCFEPIRPDNPIIAPDASRVHPRDLWVSLLSQLREGLRGRLHELSVPLRNDLLTWEQAREHVLRLGQTLGKERKQRFVIVIDGIDHAARSAQTSPQQSADFFRSLPGPDELGALNIRLLIAGQPPEHYREHYPAWLVLKDVQVLRIEMPRISTEDVRALYSASQSAIPVALSESAIRVIEENAKGNTLATVFAVEEAKRTSSVEALEAVLYSRRLGDGLQEYYSSIWNLMLANAGDNKAGVEISITSVFSYAQRGVQANLLSTAFNEWQKPTPWWQVLLECLGPLLSQASNGFRVRHNDVRVFLVNKFASYTDLQQKRAISQLADYFKRTDCDRTATHLVLFKLLQHSDRAIEQVELFNVDWVFEAAALGIESEQLEIECKAAIRSLEHKRDWQLVTSVACATHSLERLIEFREYDQVPKSSVHRTLPPFLPTEALVKPVKQWRSLDFSSLVRDAHDLIRGGELARARSLIERWVGGLTVCELAALFSDGVTHFGSMKDGIRPYDPSAMAPFEDFGTVCALLSSLLPSGKPKSKTQQQALYSFEKGFIKSLQLPTQAVTLKDIFGQNLPHFFSSWTQLVRRLMRAECWILVRDSLRLLSDYKDKLSTPVQAEASWWALRSGAHLDDASWLAPLEKERYGIERSGGFDSEHDDTSSYVRPYECIAKSIGWIRPGLDPRDIGTQVFEAYASRLQYEDHREIGLLVFRASALIGRIECLLSTGDMITAGRCVTSEQVGRFLTALWEDKEAREFQFNPTASKVAQELSNQCERIGGSHAKEAVNAALPYANRFLIDRRWSGLWQMIENAGNLELLRTWARHWLGETGQVWSKSRSEVHEILDMLEEPVIRIGEQELLSHARERQKWAVIGYRQNKDDAFFDTVEWLENAVRIAPSSWKDMGWQLWNACLECSEQDGDNEVKDTLLNLVSTSALRCGASDWWRLISTTLPQVSEKYWHGRTRQRIVNGLKLALKDEFALESNDVVMIWCLVICFSIWSDSYDAAGLRDLYFSLLDASRDAIKTAVDQISQLTPRICSEANSANTELLATKSSKKKRKATSKEILEKVERNVDISLAEAASVLRSGKGETSVGLVERILRAIGTGNDHATAWHFVENRIEVSLTEIVSHVTDDQLWSIVGSIERTLDVSTTWRYRVYRNLNTLAQVRAKVKDSEAILGGLKVHAHMHMCWAYGGHPKYRAVPVLPREEPSLTWREVTIRFLGNLFESNSAEILGAALEGSHALAMASPDSIQHLFECITSPWGRYWLLTAAESWAVLHPEAMSHARHYIEAALTGDSLVSSLQAWVVLCRLCDVTFTTRPLYPIPEPRERSNIISTPPKGKRLIKSGPKLIGHHVLVTDKYYAVASKLQRLNACGFSFSRLESNIADALADVGSSFVERGPQRDRAFLCSSFEEEQVLGQEIRNILDSSWCQQSHIARLAQAFLGNEDPWIQRRPPVPGNPCEAWVENEEYGTDKIDSSQMNKALQFLVMQHQVPANWRTFSARATSFSRKIDYDFYLWWQTYQDSLLVDTSLRPMCPSGRTFLWWLGDYYEPEIETDFVSGFFVGGMQRLSDCALEIMPPKSWRINFGWEAQNNDPFVWTKDGQVVAKYEVLHGPIRNNSRGPRQRQSVLHRWLITDAAFQEVERVAGSLRTKEEFKSSDFDEDY